MNHEDMVHALDVAVRRSVKWNRMGRSRRCPEGIARYTIRDGTLFLWCSGTNTRSELIDNFRTRTTPVPAKSVPGRVNAADLDQAIQVFYALDGLESTVNNVMVAGYSRGVAVGMVLASIIKSKVIEGKMKTVSVFFIGWNGKRTGDRGFISWFKKEIPCALYAYACDIIPFLPFYPYRQVDTIWSWAAFNPWKAHLEGLKPAAVWRSDPQIFIGD